MEQISNIAGGDTTKETMASLGLIREKDIHEQRLKIDSFIASPFRRSMNSLVERAQATAQSQGKIQNSHSTTQFRMTQIVNFTLFYGLGSVSLKLGF